MSLIFPKKEILYAPMLGTLGGGSARGFGQGVSSGIELYETGLWAMGDSTGPDGYGMVKYDTENFDRIVTSGNTPCSGSYPSQMADTYRNSTGSVYLVSADSATVKIWSSTSLNQISATNTGYGVRGMMVHGDYLYWAPTGYSYFQRRNISNVSNVGGASSEHNGVGNGDWEAIVAVPDNRLLFAGQGGYISILDESSFSRQHTQTMGGSSTEITAICYGANRAVYVGYTNGTVRRGTLDANGNSIHHTHSANLQNLNQIVEDVEVDRFGNIHVFTRDGANGPGYEVLDGTNLYSISYGNLPFNDPPAAIILNDYAYVADHNGSNGNHYKYYIPDVIAGTFNPVSSGTKRGPSTNTLLGSYDQSTIHELNLAQGGLAF